MKMMNRSLIGTAISSLLPLAAASAAANSPAQESISLPPVQQGSYEPNWKSLSQHKVPEWFRDAKFGIWSHWGPQTAPAFGDWYANLLYKEGSTVYKHHVETYGHPSVFGFKDIIPLWKAEKFDPDALAKFYRESGARYIIGMASHHDNFDNWDSTYQPWNSANMGPKKDIMALWKAAAEKQGLKFGVSIHNINSWGWYDVTREADKKGPYQGVPYDGYQTKADGKGKWWEGYDPSDLYGPPHKGGDTGDDPTPAYMANWFLRTKELIDKYQPDVLQFDLASPILKKRTWVQFEDITGAPQVDGRVGMLIGQHFYNSERKWNNGQDGGVITLKHLPEERRRGATRAFEKTYPPGLMPEPWVKELSMGDWHYRKGGSYLSPKKVVSILAEVVSHNGNFLLNVVQRPDGTIDGNQPETLRQVGQWLKENGEAIYATRPWKIAAEGPNKIEAIAGEGPNGTQEGKLPKQYTPEDIRFTQSKDGKTLHAIVMEPPKDGKVTIKSLAEASAYWPEKISSVKLANGTTLKFQRDSTGLHVDLPANISEKYALTLRVN